MSNIIMKLKDLLAKVLTMSPLLAGILIGYLAHAPIKLALDLVYGIVKLITKL